MISPDEYSHNFATALSLAQETTERSLQREPGISDIGVCHQYVLYKLRGTEPSDHVPGFAALIGSAIHEKVAQARHELRPDLLIEQKLHVSLPCGVVITGTADEIDLDEPSVTDWKSKSSAAQIAYQRRHGSTDQQRFQRHLCYLGAHQAGLVPEQGTVRNIYIDRSGHDEHLLVEQEPFSWEVVRQADEWVSDVRYAYQHNEDAMRDPHYGWCRRWCEFFTTCRGSENESYGLDNPEMVMAVESLLEARADKKTAALMETASLELLEPLRTTRTGGVVTYETETLVFRWIWVNASERRKGYWKAEVTQR